MVRAITVLLTAILISACGAMQSEPYDKDVSPENRAEYNGPEGMAQYQRDQRDLMDRELRNKCEKAKIELMLAESEKDTDEINRQKAIIDDTCVNQQ